VSTHLGLEMAHPAECGSEHPPPQARLFLCNSRRTRWLSPVLHLPYRGIPITSQPSKNCGRGGGLALHSRLAHVRYRPLCFSCSLQRPRPSRRSSLASHFRPPQAHGHHSLACLVCRLWLSSLLRLLVGCDFALRILAEHLLCHFSPCLPSVNHLHLKLHCLRQQTVRLHLLPLECVFQQWSPCHVAAYLSDMMAFHLIAFSGLDAP
jgi:hypothetical protein